MSGGNFDYDSFSDLGCTYDFVSKPFDNHMFLNRVMLLLHMSKKIQDISNTKEKIELSIWDIFNYSNVYLLVLDNNMDIKLSSYMLATDIGFNNENEILGKNWNQFIPNNLKDNINHIHKNLIQNPTTNTKYQEVTNEIVTLNGDIISVKWFNTRINNGIKLTFSIGVPLTKKIRHEDNIETLRAYWNDIIQKDRTAINTFRDIIIKGE
jgi:PAS domain S-box-containing protein